MRRILPFSGWSMDCMLYLAEVYVLDWICMLGIWYPEIEEDTVEIVHTRCRLKWW